MWLILMDGLQKRCSKIDVPFFFFLSEVNRALKVLGFLGFFFKELNSKFYQVGMHSIMKRITKLPCLQFWIFVFVIFFKQGRTCILGSSLKCQKYTDSNSCIFDLEDLILRICCRNQERLQFTQNVHLLWGSWSNYLLHYLLISPLFNYLINVINLKLPLWLLRTFWFAQKQFYQLLKYI